MGKRIITFICIGLILMCGSGSMAFAQPIQGKRIVVIDAAHGGSDQGVKLSDGIKEKDVTLAVARQIEKELARWGNIQVQLTRTSDKSMSLEERAKFIRTAKADMLISLHVNAGFDKKSTGYEIYFPGFKTPSGGKNESKAILKDMAKNRYLNDSVKLAHAIGRHLAGVFPRMDRGLREAPVPILDGLTIPAVVVEIGFATRVEDRDKLMNDSTQQAVARAISKGIKDAL
jgi:N-acetylmuramoyl-L-alanine amidase